MKDNKYTSTGPTGEIYGKARNYRAWETAEIIHDLTLGNPPRHPADTPEKKAKIKRLKKDIAEAASKGHVIHVPD